MSKLANKYQTRYCVIHNRIFYYFESCTSKKQQGAFELSEYEARPAYHLFKDLKKKECSFELVSPSKRTYRFLAGSFDGMKDWIHAVASASKVPHPSTIPKPSELAAEDRSTRESQIDVTSDNDLSDPAQSSGSGSIRLKTYPVEESDLKCSNRKRKKGKQLSFRQDICDHGDAENMQQLYDDPDTMTSPQYPSGYLRGHELQHEEYDEAAVDKSHLHAEQGKTNPENHSHLDNTQDLYDETVVDNIRKDPRQPYHRGTSEVNQGVYDEGAADQEDYDHAVVDFPLKKCSRTSQPYNKPESPQEEYDHAEIAAHPAKESVPARSPRRKALPPVPSSPRLVFITPDDYANMFYGIWDCTAIKEHELSFKKGDIIHVIERKYEENGWLTGLINGRVGLVPKTFLTPAYNKA